MTTDESLPALLARLAEEIREWLLDDTYDLGDACDKLRKSEAALRRASESLTVPTELQCMLRDERAAALSKQFKLRQEIDRLRLALAAAEKFHDAWVEAEVARAIGDPDLAKQKRAELVKIHQEIAATRMPAPQGLDVSREEGGVGLFEPGGLYGPDATRTPAEQSSQEQT